MKLDLGKEEIEAVAKVLKSGWIMNGPVTEKFEQEVARYVQNKYAAAVSSGTAALYLTLKALSLKPGDKVITPSYSFVASAYTINLCGVKPIFADVDLKTFNITPREIEKRLTKKTKAVIVVHQFGLPCDLDPIYNVSKKYHLEVVEDAACALGSLYKGRSIGSNKKIVCFSFHPRKVITTGEGGMVVSNDKKVAEKLKSLRNHGLVKRECVEELVNLGFNCRLTDIQSALGLVQLKKLGKFLTHRKKVANFYNQSFRNNPYFDIPFIPVYATPNWQSYAITLKEKYAHKRGKLIKELRRKGILVKEGITPIHKMPYYNERVLLPNSEYLSKASILLPIYPGLTRAEVMKIKSEIFKSLNA